MKTAYDVVLKALLTPTDHPLDVSHLRLLVRLAYRALALDFKSRLAYSALAYVFALLGEPERAYALVLQCQKFWKTDAGLAQALTVFESLLLSSSLDDKGELDAVQVSFDPTEPTLPLPTYAEALAQLQGASVVQMQSTSERLTPALLPMLERIAHLEVPDE